jgi:hypothetical protein
MEDGRAEVIQKKQDGRAKKWKTAEQKLNKKSKKLYGRAEVEQKKQIRITSVA